MIITLTDSLLVLAVLSLLMLGFVARRSATAQATRSLNKDSIKGDRHHKQDKTMIVLRNRLSLQSSMLIFSSCGAISAFVAAISIVFDTTPLTNVAFVFSLVFGLFSVVQALRESIIANNSHFQELDMTISKHDPYYKTPSA